MSSPSNLYAEKVFAEHPISMWAFDDQADYVSFISESERNIAGGSWTVQNGDYLGVAPESYLKQQKPFPDSVLNAFVGLPAPAPFVDIILKSSNVFSISELDQSKETFAIGAYVYAANPYVLGYEIGFEYTSGGQTKQTFRFFNSTVYDQWLFISETFKIPQLTADIKIIIKARYSIDPANPLPQYLFFLNGLSVGQWSEDFNTYSLGINQSEYSSFTTPTFSGTGIKAYAYGKEDGYGYYVADSKNIYAKNFGVPLVFGSGNVTKIYPNGSNPSIIIPGNGFLNDSGRFQEYTIEAWLRARPESNELRKIIGPLGSSNGIYINGPFITLVIGNSVQSHYVGQWFRPILLNLKLGINYANLLINSEQVISISFDTETLDMNDINNDWIGIYGYDDIPLLEIDVVGIYPYQIPGILLKRRLGYAQAVESPEGVNRAYGGVVAAVDYKFADYTSNYNYPLTGKWAQGIVENIKVDDDTLAPPQYLEPELVLSSISSDQWINSQSGASNSASSFFKFNELSDGYMYLDSFKLPFQEIAALYGVFKVDSLSQEEKVLIKVENQITNSSFTIQLVNGTIQYKFSSWGQERNLYYKTGISENTVFFAGVNVRDISDVFGEDIEAFFANRQQLKIYIANNKEMTKQFDGNIYKIGISTYRNSLKIKDMFDNIEFELLQVEADSGEPETNEWEYYFDGGTPFSFTEQQMLSHVPSYGIIIKNNFGKKYLDSETDSYWEDYIPLSHFSQYVDDIFGNKYYDLDFIQFNVDYPSFKKYDGALYDTSDNIVKTYISFQHISSGANAPAEYFTSIEGMPKNGVVIPKDNWMYTKYEVVDGAVIYPPKDADVQTLAIVTHIEMSAKGVKTNPISVKKIEYSSEAFNDFTSNPVGTKYGVPLYPYSQYASSFDYKSANPFRIYKGSTPHLYLTNDSGINRVGDYSTVVPRGISIPINAGSAEQYRVIAMQMFMMYNKDAFASQAIQLFEVSGTDKYLRFYIKANDRTGQRGRIYAVNAKTGTTEDGIAFYINGNLVRDPVISLNEWVSIGVSFATTMSFDEYPGAIRLTDTVLFNNIAYYESTSLQEVERQSKRTWSRIFTEYEDWLNLLQAALVGNFLWNDVLVTSSVSFFGINPGDIYKAYIGINKQSVEGAEELLLGDAEIRVFTDIEWSSNVITPV
jgi:hypothetical protein